MQGGRRNYSYGVNGILADPASESSFVMGAQTLLNRARYAAQRRPGRLRERPRHGLASDY